ncbi:hypothetical protein MIND_00980700 [Mycena indigotica]|uniref:F-box domain-containing protein n=1 Tax=Mycena indigotica TaxID=2126181 RepID=A0A8H6SDD5_9AGAR|nr:uncharacterized protein MIND_00980700 [Mycena indigotica]KAF7297470.1 hypothetical protein MIND_00980700 [Mycena indigotica]
MPPLPPELIEHIVGHIRTQASLKKCCLAARAFVHPCQKRLLATLSLPVAKPSRWKRAVTHFEQSPHLALLVARLNIELDWDVPEPGAFAAVGPDFLAQMAQLKGVSFTSNTTGVVSWGRMPAPVDVALTALFLDRRRQQRPLDYVTLHHVSDISSRALSLYIGACKRLRFTSSIAAAHKPEDDNESFEGGYGDQPVTSISLRYTSTVARRLGDTQPLRVCLPAIAFLTLSGHDHNIEDLLPAYALLAPTIPRIELPSMYDIALDDAKAYALPTNWPALRVLTARFTANELEDSPPWTVTQLIDTMLQPEACPQLSELVVVLRVKIDDSEYYDDEDEEDEDDEDDDEDNEDGDEKEEDDDDDNDGEEEQEGEDDSADEDTDEEPARKGTQSASAAERKGPFDSTLPIAFAFNPATIARLDTRAVSHPTLASLCWEVVIEFKSTGMEYEGMTYTPHDVEKAKVQYVACCAALKELMPEMVAKGKLAFRSRDPEP